MHCEDWPVTIIVDDAQQPYLVQSTDIAPRSSCILGNHLLSGPMAVLLPINKGAITAIASLLISASPLLDGWSKLINSLQTELIIDESKALKSLISYVNILI